MERSSPAVFFPSPSAKWAIRVSSKTLRAPLMRNRLPPSGSTVPSVSTRMTGPSPWSAACSVYPPTTVTPRALAATSIRGSPQRGRFSVVSTPGSSVSGCAYPRSFPVIHAFVGAGGGPTATVTSKGPPFRESSSDEIL
jgi:hypothetical protein